jgi:hypothetical protein
MYHTWRRFHCFCTLFCLVLLLSACSQFSANGASLTSTPTQTAIPPTTPTPGQAAVQTCPAQATARAAIMPPLTAGNHPNLVYVSQQDGSSILQRYDVTTGSLQTILQTHATETIQEANVSPDGQWVLLVSRLQDQFALQLVRVDGQYLQTLYCAPAQTSTDAVLLSPDQRSLVFNQVNQDESISMLYLLDMTTGKLRTELSPFQPNYPGSAQGQLQTTLMSARTPSIARDKTTGKLTIHPFNPLPSQHYLIYVPMKWANNGVYLLGTIRGSGALPHQLALLRDMRKDVAQQRSNLQSITATEDNGCQDYDVTADNQQLICSAYSLMGSGGPSAINMRPIIGGALHTVYHDPLGGMIVARVLSNSTLIFILDKPNSPPTLWKINTNGSGLTQLMAAQTKDMILDFASSSYLPWSIASRDGRHYALTMYNMTSNASSLIVGDLNGGQAKTIASSANSLLLVGWAELS